MDPTFSGWHDRCQYPVALGLGNREDTINITIWLATRERGTWIAAAEILGIAVVLFMAPGTTLARMLGLPLLAHLGYSAMTSLPVGAIPGRPAGMAKKRRNQVLRTRVMAFLNEVRRVEEYAQRASFAGLPGDEVEDDLRSAQKRLMAAAAEVVKVTGRVGV